MRMLERYQADILQLSTMEDQAKLLHQDIALSRSPEELGIKNPEIVDQIMFTFNLQNQIREKIEESQRRTFRSLIVFTRRCIDVIQFLKIVSFTYHYDLSTSNQLFSQMLKQILKQKGGISYLKELQKTTY